MQQLISKIINICENKYNFHICKIRSYTSDMNYIVYYLENGYISYYYLTSLSNLIDDLLHLDNFEKLCSESNFNGNIIDLKKSFKHYIPLCINYVDDITSDPTYHKIIFNDKIKEYINLFRFPSIFNKPINKTITSCDFPIIYQLIFNLCGNNQEAYDWFIKWIALSIQYPTEKTTNAVIIAGYFGAGKNEFSDILCEIFENTVQIISPDMLNSSFNTYLEGKLFIIGDEIAYSSHSDKFYVANKLKPIISNRLIQVNEKFKPAHNSKNFTRFIIFSNDKNVIPIDSGDRRYLVLNPANTLLPSKDQNTCGLFDFEFYSNWKQTNFKQECLNFGIYLKSLDCSKQQLYQAPPMTYEKQQIIILNSSNFKIVIEECIKDSLKNIRIDNNKNYLDFNDLFNSYKLKFINPSKQEDYLSLDKFRSKLSVYCNIFTENKNFGVNTLEYCIIPQSLMDNLKK